jgi:hypothetical protein
MKYFVLSAVAAIGFANAVTPDPCFDDEYKKFINETLDGLTGGNNALEKNYLVRSKTYLGPGGGSNFVTIACAYKGWQGQDNGNVYDPYSVTKWSPESASQYAQFKKENEALDAWVAGTGKNGKNGNWPAGAFGRYRCGNFKNETTLLPTRGWKNIREPLKCHTFDKPNGWVDFLAQTKKEEMPETGLCINFYGHRVIDQEEDDTSNVDLSFKWRFTNNTKENEMRVTQHTNFQNKYGEYLYSACGAESAVANANSTQIEYGYVDAKGFNGDYGMKIHGIVSMNVAGHNNAQQMYGEASDKEGFMYFDGASGLFTWSGNRCQNACIIYNTELD